MRAPDEDQPGVATRTRTTDDARAAEVFRDHRGEILPPRHTCAPVRSTTAAFWYDYRDDAFPGTEECGLRRRDQSRTPAYLAFADHAKRRADLVAPAGEVTSLLPLGTTWGRLQAVTVRGWAIDADGLAPTVELAYDGQVVATMPANQPGTGAPCSSLGSAGAACPNVHFRIDSAAPATGGFHEVAVRVTDVDSNRRVIHREVIDVP